MGTCRLIRPIESPSTLPFTGWILSGRTRCSTEEHPIPSLLNLSTRERGDVDPPQASFGLSRRREREAEVVGTQGPGSHRATSPREKPWDSRSRDHAILHQPPFVIPSCLSVVREDTTTFWALSNHPGGTRFGPTSRYGARRRICSGCLPVSRHTILARKEAYCSG